jgi:hypothetical protein
MKTVQMLPELKLPNVFLLILFLLAAPHHSRADNMRQGSPLPGELGGIFFLPDDSKPEEKKSLVSTVFLNGFVVEGDVVLLEPAGRDPTDLGEAPSAYSDVLRFTHNRNGGVATLYSSVFPFVTPNGKLGFRQTGVGGATLLDKNTIFIDEANTDFTPYAAGGNPFNTNEFIIDSTSVLSLIPNETVGPTGGDGKSPRMSFDATTGTLSFTDGTVNFLNLAGDRSNNPTFANDPIMGATIRVGDFALRGRQGQVFLFSDGTLTIFKGNQVFFDATIPNLLIDDSAQSGFKNNIFAPLVISRIDTTSSHFLDIYNQFSLDTLFPQEFFWTHF